MNIIATSAVNASLLSDSDSEKLTKVLEWLQESLGADSEVNWITEAQEDYDFYAGKQDAQEVLDVLAEQKRPATVYNEVKPKIDILLGIAGQSRRTPYFVPVESTDEALSEIVNGAFKFFRRTSKMDNNEMSCFEHVLKGGRSLLHFYIDNDEDPAKPEIRSVRIHGRNFHLDPLGVEYDMSDHRFLFVDKWMWAKDINAIWPEIDLDMVKGFSQSADNLPSFYDTKRDMYCIRECWYRDYEVQNLIVNPVSGKEEIVDNNTYKQLVVALRQGVTVQGKEIKADNLKATKKLVKVIKYIIFSANYIIADGISPYRMKRFPYILFGGYLDDDENRWFSAITMMKDPQRGLNTMHRQFKHLLQTAPKGILMHEIGAIVDIDAYERDSSNPNYHMAINQGKFDKVRFSDQPGISPVYAQLIDFDKQFMKDVSGIQDPLLGIQTTSREPGISLRARQEASIAVLFPLYENFRKSRTSAAEFMFSLIQQYITYERVIRIEGEEGQKLIQINSQTSKDNEGFNDITVGKYDLTIDEIAEFSTMRIAIMQILADYAHQNPGTIPPDLLMEYSDLPLSAKLRVRDYSAQQQKRQDDMEKAKLAQVQNESMNEVALKKLELFMEERIAKMEAAVRLQIAGMTKSNQSKGE